MNEYNINRHMLSRMPNVYGGSERKETILLDDGNTYLLKLPDPTREAKRKISYINNAVSEYLGCKIFKSVGIPVQEVILGEYTTQSSGGEPKTYIACLCKDLTEGGYRLAPMETTALSSENGGKFAEIASFDTLEKISEYTSGVSLDEIKKFYADMFVVDAFLGNTDRHNGNWGFLAKFGDVRISPVYDCGSSLSPLLDDSEMDARTALAEAMNGMSAIMEDGKRIPYRTYLLAGSNTDVNDALKRIVPRIQMKEIAELLDQTPYISQRRHDFYQTFLTAKYEQVLIPALENVLNKELHFSGRDDHDKNAYDCFRQIRDELKSIPLHEAENAYVGPMEVNIIHATNNQYIFTNPETNEAEAIVSLKNSRENIWKMIEALSQTYDVSEIDLSISHANSYEHSDNQEQEGFSKEFSVPVWDEEEL